VEVGLGPWTLKQGALEQHWVGQRGLHTAGQEAAVAAAAAVGRCSVAHWKTALACCCWRVGQ
jgi:hypothetical protein